MIGVHTEGSAGVRSSGVRSFGVRSFGLGTTLHRALLVAAVLVAGLLLSGPVGAQPPSSGTTLDAPLEVAIKHAPPFAVRSAEGGWSGLSVERWRCVADTLDLDYRFRETDLAGIFTGLEAGRYDIAVAALTISEERLERVTFTKPYHTTGLAVAMAKRKPQWLEFFSTLVQPTFLVLIAALGLAQFIVGTLVWLLERRANPDQFPPALRAGLASGFWWSTVTMTTVGYGDKAPKTPLGRTLALLWMFASMIAIAMVTATIASSLTVERYDLTIHDPDDLARFRVGTLARTTSAEWLEGQRIPYATFESRESAFEALGDGRIEALVWDEPLLRWAIEQGVAKGVELVPRVLFERQHYGFALPKSTSKAELEGINGALESCAIVGAP